MIEKVNRENVGNLAGYILLCVVSAVSIALAVTQDYSGNVTLGLILAAFLSAILFLEFETLKLKFRDVQMELGSRGRSSEHHFREILEIAQNESDRAYALLTQIESESTSIRTFDELSNVIEQGLVLKSSSPFEYVLQVMNEIVSTKKYTSKYDDTEMKVVRFENDTLYVKSEERGPDLKRGMKFEVVRIGTQPSGEEIEEVSERVAIAEVSLAQKRTTELKIIRWEVRTDQEEIIEIRNNNLLDRRVTVDIITPEEIEEISQDELEETQRELQRLFYGKEG
ncbi:hypothetical protein [Natronorubrum sp. FCH18a]|uniref:hypothetical protein n=1 Tax=Natronorubrum sp. FCH18a TaxID=3447018 RepID=UPI003F518824